MKKWVKVTPVPPEMNGHGFLWNCPYCGRCITSVMDYPSSTKCPECGEPVARKETK